MGATKISSEVHEGEKEWPQILAVLVACLCALTGGLLFFWPSPSIPILISPNTYLPGTTIEMASYLTLIPAIALIIFAYPACNLVDAIGRKKCVMLIAFPQVIGWALIITGGNIWILYLSRIVSGIGDTLVFASIPVYIGEVATPRIRGTWGNAFMLMLFAGAFLVNLVGAYSGIRETACFFIWIPLVFFISMCFMPETPYYYVMKEMDDEAKKSLKWLRGKEDVDAEFNEISSAVKRQLADSGKLADLFRVKSNRKALVICAMLRFTQQYSGISAFNVYAQYLFKEAGGDLSASVSAIIFTALTFVCGFFGSIFLDRLGRRKATISSGAGCVVVLVLMGSFLKLKEAIDLSSVQWFPIVGMVGFIICFSLGFATVPTMMLGEMFSSSIKGKALATMNVIFGVLMASSMKIFQWLSLEFGMWVPFLFFGVVTCVGTVVCYFILVETKGKTLDEIQLELEGHKMEGPKRNSEHERELHI